MIWLLASAGFALCLLPAGIIALRADDAVQRLVGLEFGAICQTLCLACLAEAFNRVGFLDVALAFALLSYGGGLVFARFQERWL